MNEIEAIKKDTEKGKNTFTSEEINFMYRELEFVKATLDISMEENGNMTPIIAVALDKTDALMGFIVGERASVEVQP